MVLGIGLIKISKINKVVILIRQLAEKNLIPLTYCKIDIFVVTDSSSLHSSDKKSILQKSIIGLTKRSALNNFLEK